jgi:hypothetical protein
MSEISNNIVGNYTVPIDERWKQSQTRLVTLNVDVSDVASIITLPEIADIMAINGRHVRGVVSDILGNSGGGNTITVGVPDGSTDRIEGNTKDIISTNFETRIYTIANDGSWAIS